MNRQSVVKMSDLVIMHGMNPAKPLTVSEWLKISQDDKEF